MARPKARIPAYYLHKSSGRAYLTPDGKPVYRGEHGTPESHDKFTQVIAEWISRARGPVIVAPVDPMASITVSQVIAAQLHRPA